MKTQPIGPGPAEPVAQKAGYPPAGMLRRLAAMFYDGLLLVSVLMAAIALALALSHGDFTYQHPVFKALVILLCFLFYAGFWLYGGQTLGMRTWRMRLQGIDGRPVTLRQAVLRFLLAIPSLALAGLGFFWMLLDRDKQTLYDRLSGTVMVLLPEKA